jgi:hypothetical protein
VTRIFIQKLPTLQTTLVALNLKPKCCKHVLKDCVFKFQLLLAFFQYFTSHVEIVFAWTRALLLFCTCRLLQPGHFLCSLYLRDINICEEDSQWVTFMAASFHADILLSELLFSRTLRGFTSGQSRMQSNHKCQGDAKICGELPWTERPPTVRGEWGGSFW